MIKKRGKASGEVANWQANLKWLVDHHDSSLVELCGAIGITSTGFYFLRMGYKLPQLDTAAAIARVFGVTLGDMLILPSAFKSAHAGKFSATTSPRKAGRRKKKTATQETSTPKVKKTKKKAKDEPK